MFVVLYLVSSLSQVQLIMSRGISQQDGSYKLTLNATYYYAPVTKYKDQYSVVLVIFNEDRAITTRAGNSQVRLTLTDTFHSNKHSFMAMFPTFGMF